MDLDGHKKTAQETFNAVWDLIEKKTAATTKPWS